MKNSKLTTLNVMNVQALMSNDLLAITGGNAKQSELVIDIVSGVIDLAGKRTATSFTTKTIHVDASDTLKALFAKYLAS